MGISSALQSVNLGTTLAKSDEKCEEGGGDKQPGGELVDGDDHNTGRDA